MVRLMSRIRRVSIFLTDLVDELLSLSRFGALGVVLNMLAFLTYYAAVVFFKSNPVFAVLWITPLYVMISFFAQQKFVFKTKKYTLVKGVRFSFFYLSFYLLNLFGIYVLVELADADPILSQALLVILIGAVSYLTARWLFLK